MTTNERIAEILGYPPLAVVPPFETSLDACAIFERWLQKTSDQWWEAYMSTSQSKCPPHVFAFGSYLSRLGCDTTQAILATPAARCRIFLAVMAAANDLAPQTTAVATSPTKGEKQVGRSGV